MINNQAIGQAIGYIIEYAIDYFIGMVNGQWLYFDLSYGICHFL